MDDQKIIAEQELRDIYYDPSAGYQSAEKLYRKAKEQGLKNVSRKDIKNWLRSQDTYTRYKSVIRKHKYRKTFVKGLADQMPLDLVNMGKIRIQKQRLSMDINGNRNFESVCVRHSRSQKKYGKHDESCRGAARKF